MPGTTDEAFVDALPKHELHVHLEGSMPPETLLALARRHGTPGLPHDLDGIRRMYEFRESSIRSDPAFEAAVRLSMTARAIY